MIDLKLGCGLLRKTYYAVCIFVLFITLVVLSHLLVMQRINCSSILLAGVCCFPCVKRLIRLYVLVPIKGDMESGSLVSLLVIIVYGMIGIG